MAPGRPVAIWGAVCVAIALAACSSDDEATVSTALTTPPTPTTVPLTSPPTTPPTTPAPTTVPPTTEVGFDSEWCVRAADVRSAGDRFDSGPTDPDVVEEIVTELVVSIRAASEVVPDELADAVATSEGFAIRLDAALAETGYDLLTADLSVLEELREEMDAASQTIRAFDAEFCGLELVDADAEESTTGFDFGAGSLRDQFIGQLVDDGFTTDEAACLFDAIDFTDPASYTGDEAVTALFVECDIDLARIGELSVPDEVEGE